MVDYRLLQNLFGFGANLVEGKIESVREVSTTSGTRELKRFLDDMLGDTKQFGTLDRVIIHGDVTLDYSYAADFDKSVIQFTNAMIGRPSYGKLSVSDKYNNYVIFTPDNTKRPNRPILEITNEKDDSWKVHLQRYGGAARSGAHLDISIPAYSKLYLVKAKE